MVRYNDVVLVIVSFFPLSPCPSFFHFTCTVCDIGGHGKTNCANYVSQREKVIAYVVRTNFLPPLFLEIHMFYYECNRCATKMNGQFSRHKANGKSWMDKKVLMKIQGVMRWYNYFLLFPLSLSDS